VATQNVVQIAQLEMLHLFVNEHLKRLNTYIFPVVEADYQ